MCSKKQTFIRQGYWNKLTHLIKLMMFIQDYQFSLSLLLYSLFARLASRLHRMRYLSLSRRSNVREAVLIWTLATYWTLPQWLEVIFATWIRFEDGFRSTSHLHATPHIFHIPDDVGPFLFFLLEGWHRLWFLLLLPLFNALTIHSELPAFTLLRDFLGLLLEEVQGFTLVFCTRKS